MKGTILDYSVPTNEGIITGDDNGRYKFLGSEWKATVAPAHGQRVDFDVANGRATQVFQAMSETLNESQAEQSAGILWMPITSMTIGIICALSVFDDSQWDSDQICGGVLIIGTGLTFGIVCLAKKFKKGRGMAIAGVVLNSIALIVTLGRIAK
jgi:hypothetical protein